MCLSQGLTRATLKTEGRNVTNRSREVASLARGNKYVPNDAVEAGLEHNKNRLLSIGASLRITDYSLHLSFRSSSLPAPSRIHAHMEHATSIGI